jgi:hypothetical protein
MIQLVRQNAMPAAMSRQKVNAPLVHFSADERIGWPAKWRLHVALARLFHAFHLIKPAASDNSNCRRLVLHGAHSMGSGEAWEADIPLGAKQEVI